MNVSPRLDKPRTSGRAISGQGEKEGEKEEGNVFCIIGGISGPTTFRDSLGGGGGIG